MNTEESAFYWISIGYLVVLIISSLAAVRLWKLNDAFELGATNRSNRRTANVAVLSLAMIGAFASVVLFFLSQRTSEQARLEQQRLHVRTLELEKELQLVRPRRITEEIKAKISTAIKSEKKNIKVLLTVVSDPEAKNFANELAKAFIDGGWSVEDSGDIYISSDVGVKVDGKSPEIQRVMEKSGLEFSVQPWMTSEKEGAEPGIFVGSKPVR